MNDIDLSLFCGKSISALLSKRLEKDYEELGKKTCGTIGYYKDKHGICSTSEVTFLQLEEMNFVDVGEAGNCDGEKGNCTGLKGGKYDGVKFKKHACIVLPATELGEKLNGLDYEEMKQVITIEAVNRFIDKRHKINDELAIKALMNTIGEDADHIIEAEAPTNTEMIRLDRMLPNSKGLVVDRALITQMLTTEDCSFNQCATLGDCTFGEFKGNGFRGCVAETKNPEVQDVIIAGIDNMVSVDEYMIQPIKVTEEVSATGVCYKLNFWLYVEVKVPFWNFKLPNNTVYTEAVAFEPSNWEKLYDGFDDKYAPAVIWKKASE